MSVHTVNASAGLEVQQPEFLSSALDGGQPPASRHRQPIPKLQPPVSTEQKAG